MVFQKGKINVLISRITIIVVANSAFTKIINF